MILVDVRARDVLHLDRTATWFVQQLDGKRTLAAVLRRICRRYDVEPAVARGDLHDLVEPLLRQGLLERIEKP